MAAADFCDEAKFGERATQVFGYPWCEEPKSRPSVSGEIFEETGGPGSTLSELTSDQAAQGEFWPLTTTKSTTTSTLCCNRVSTTTKPTTGQVSEVVKQGVKRGRWLVSAMAMEVGATTRLNLYQ